MQRKRRTARRRRGLLALLLALVALLGFRLSGLFPGLLPGGGWRPDREHARAGPDGPHELRLAVLDPVTLSPIEGALIHVADAAGEGVTWRAGPDGSVRVDPAAPGGTGRGELWGIVSRESTGMGVRVSRTTIAGRVTGADGTPLHAELRARDDRGAERGSAASDAHGRFQLRLASSPDGLPVLEPGAHLEGRLEGAGPGALEVYALIASPFRDELLALATTWTLDAEGHYEGTLPEDARAWGVYEGRPVALHGGVQGLPPGASATGSVRARDGAPVPGARLRFAPWLDPVWVADRPAVEALADGQGRFSVAGLARVRYQLTVKAPGFATRIHDEVELGGTPLELALDPGFGLDGIVVDGESRPVAGVALRARGLPDPGSERPRAHATSDAAGRFRLEGLGGEYAEVWAESAGAEPWFVGRVEPGSDLRVVLPR